MTRATRLHAALTGALLTAALAGCVASAPTVKTEGELLGRWGEPQASYVDAQGARYWFYRTRQGEGPGQRWRVVLDAQGQVQERAQAFQAAAFEALKGQHRDAVLHRMGPPHVSGGGGEEPVRWTYRFREGANDLEAQLQFTSSGEVSGVQVNKDRFHRDHYEW